MSPTTTHYYLLNLTYTRPLAEVKAHLDAHSRYLASAYERGVFLLSGRKEPWTGGIILARAASLEEIQRVIAEDPYLQMQVTTYEITEFVPTRASADLSSVVV